jgi:capsular exopolysaccharide synthesis family protein
MNILVSKLDEASAVRTPLPAKRGSGSDSVPLLQQYLRIAIRWRWLIAGVTAACILLGLVVTLLMTPQFTATTTIEISRVSDQVTSFQGVEREIGVADQEFYQTQYGLLRSQTLAERVATQLGLADDAAFFEMFGVESDDPAFALTNGRYSASGRPVRQRTAGEILLDNLGVEPARMSRLVGIHFTSPDPTLSARVANAWSENFIQTNLERKIQATSYGREQLQRQLAEYKDRLDASQRQLVTYASNEQIINLPAESGGNGVAGTERSIVSDDLAALNAALAEATSNRIEAEARFRQSGSEGASLTALSNQAINNLRQRRAELAAEYEQLMVRFEPGYPAARAIQSQIDELDQAIRREETRVSNSFAAGYREAQAREAALQEEVGRLKGEFLDLRRRSIQYNIYQQEVDTNRALYDGLLQRFKEIGVAGGVGVNNIAIVDLAQVPLKPSSPRLLINLLVSVLAGMILGVAMALALEQIDEAIADPNEIERRLGLPLLGTVPVSKAETPKEALADPKSELFDAYLAVQTNLGFSTEHGVPRSFAVTSTRPGEGKSTTSLALASTLTRAGRKVILVDGDMRSPSVHNLAGVGHELGLSNFLAGDDDLSGLTFEMPGLRFTAMSSGPIPPNAAELLTGNRLSLLIERLLLTYDHVVIDSPPVMGLADAPLIASRVEGVIYAVESRSTRSSIAKTALTRLQSANVHVIGAVLTKFNSRKAHYGYGYDYGYDYGRSGAEENPA